MGPMSHPPEKQRVKIVGRFSILRTGSESETAGSHGWDRDEHRASLRRTMMRLGVKLLRPQREHRVDQRRAARRQVARDHRDAGEEERHEREGRGIVWRDAIEAAGENARSAIGGDKAQREAEADE